VVSTAMYISCSLKRASASNVAKSVAELRAEKLALGT
jgi:hypothetical protein